MGASNENQQWAAHTWLVELLEWSGWTFTADVLPQLAIKGITFQDLQYVLRHADEFDAEIEYGICFFTAVGSTLDDRVCVVRGSLESAQDNVWIDSVDLWER